MEELGAYVYTKRAHQTELLYLSTQCIRRSSLVIIGLEAVHYLYFPDELVGLVLYSVNLLCLVCLTRHWQERMRTLMRERVGTLRASASRQAGKSLGTLAFFIGCMQVSIGLFINTMVNVEHPATRYAVCMFIIFMVTLSLHEVTRHGRFLERLDQFVLKHRWRKLNRFPRHLLP